MGFTNRVCQKHLVMVDEAHCTAAEDPAERPADLLIECVR